MLPADESDVLRLLSEEFMRLRAEFYDLRKAHATARTWRDRVDIRDRMADCVGKMDALLSGQLLFDLI